MSHICIIELTDSSDQQQQPATLTIARIDDKTGEMIGTPYNSVSGKLNIEKLIELNQQIIEKFQSNCQNQYYGGIEVPEEILTNGGNGDNRANELQADVNKLQNLLNTTFKQSSWADIREELLRSLIGIDPSEPIRLVILTDNHDIQALPLERALFSTNGLDNGNRKVSVVFAPRRKPTKIEWHDEPKILLVFGSQEGIKSAIEPDEITRYFPIQSVVEVLIHPSKEKLLEVMGDRAFDIIIMIGHSRANPDGSDGVINIDEQISLSIDELTEPFKNSIERGLKLVILAGCSSIAAARALASSKIGVHNVIAFRVPVHYLVLKQFFKRLFHYWIQESQSLESALTKTRGELSIQNQNNPGASILPILFTSIYAPPLQFPNNDYDFKVDISKIINTTLESATEDPVKLPVELPVELPVKQFDFNRKALIFAGVALLAACIYGIWWWNQTPEKSTPIADKQCSSPNLVKGSSNRYGVIEIGSKGLKAEVIEKLDSPNNDGFKYVALTANQPIKTRNVNAINQSAQAETVNAVADVMQEIKTEFKISCEQIVIYGSSGLAEKAPHKDQLINAIQTATGRKVDLISTADEAKYVFDGVVPNWRRSEVITIDIGSGNTKGAFLQPGNNSFETYDFPVGTASFSHEIDAQRGNNSFISAAETQKNAIVIPAIRNIIQRKPALLNSPRIYLAGGISWALATLTRPCEREYTVKQQERVASFTRLQVNDINTFYAATQNPSTMFTPDLSACTPEQRTKALEDIDKIKKGTFSENDLIAGAEILRALSQEVKFDKKDLFFARYAIKALPIGYLSQQLEQQSN